MSSADTLAVWPQLAETEFTLTYVDAGPVRTRTLIAGSGPPLILMHGTGGHLEAFMRNIAELSKAFRVIAFDFVGHGYSAAPDEPYTIDTYADQLGALMDALGIERAHLSGESLGGWVAAWFAERHPERVDRLVLVCPGNITMKLETMAKLRESTRKAVLEPSRDTVRSRLEWLFAEETRHLVTDELVDIRLAIYSRPQARESIENVLVLQDPDVRRRYTWQQEWCSRIQTETLILWTEHDPTGPPSEGELLDSWMPDSRLIVLPAAGHWPQWERTQDFNRLHQLFLQHGKLPE